MRSALQSTESNAAVGRVATDLKVDAAGLAQFTENAKTSTRSWPVNRWPSIWRRKKFGVPAGGGGPSRSLGCNTIEGAATENWTCRAGCPASIRSRSKAQTSRPPLGKPRWVDM